jgi:hypothetical protein
MKVLSFAVLAACLSAPFASAQHPPGEGPAIGHRMTQGEFVNGGLTEDELRAAGQKMFSTPFNKMDGWGDGPVNVLDTTSPGGRPTLQGNGAFLRVNGLDAQTCMECHSVGSNAEAPFRFGVGGVGGANNNAIGGPRNIDVDDELGVGYASFDGRFINPPFLFGSGGVELLGKEMTMGLQRLKRLSAGNPDQTFRLDTHGVNFGLLTWRTALGGFDFSQVHGVDNDLVVRPFGRKGEFPTVRAFDVAAMQFHFGMQPIEAVGSGADDDGDGVVDEVMVGELSALHLFNVTLRRPFEEAPTPETQAGQDVFLSAGCAVCHVPALETQKRFLPMTFPEVEQRPFENTFYNVDLGAAGNVKFAAVPGSGLRIDLFSDLKRHDMGLLLAESAGSVLDSEFITARLWGVADTAPYLHDGRALTLTEAILFHGGEAQASRDSFASLADTDKIRLLTYLRSLRTPLDPTGGL